jgi:hypothetical protein
MSDYKKIVEKILKKSNVKVLNEGVVYSDNMVERMHPKLEEDIINKTHSLGKHPIFPEDDESSFEEKIMGERFKEVVNRYKRVFDADAIDNKSVLKDLMPMVYETMGLEAKHKKQLEKIAVDMIRDEFDMSEDVVEIHAELVSNVSLEGSKKNPKPVSTETEFKNYDEILVAKDEVYKRRFINAMIQGAAKKTNHMFHMVDDELTELDPRLPNKYSKLMSTADYIYYIIPAMENGVNGGVVRVQFPTASNPKAIIYAQAMVFPVLIHELVKGVMELISGHGLPKEKRIGQYVIDKADFLAAEPWDMRIGPAIWSRFTSLIDPDDFNLKHHIYTELVSLPVKQFNIAMREIMVGTKEGKKIIGNIVTKIKEELKNDEFEDAINELSVEEKNTYSFDELFGDLDDNNQKNSDSEGFDFEDLT